MRKLILLLLLLPVVANATAPAIDSTAAFSRSPWQFNVIWTGKDTASTGIYARLYYEVTAGMDTTTWDSTSSDFAGVTNGIGVDVLPDGDTLRTAGIIKINYLTNNTAFTYRLGCWIGGDSDTTWNVGTVKPRLAVTGLFCGFLDPYSEQSNYQSGGLYWPLVQMATKNAWGELQWKQFQKLVEL